MISGSERLVRVYSTNDPLLKWEWFRQNTQSIVEANLISGILLSINGPGQRRSICKDNLNTFKVPHYNVLPRVLSSWQFGLIVNRWITEIYPTLPGCPFSFLSLFLPLLVWLKKLRSWILAPWSLTFNRLAPFCFDHSNCRRLSTKCHFVSTTVRFKSSFEGARWQKQKSCMLLCSHHSQPSL